VVDFITPETDTSHHYFWGMARNFKPQDAALTDSIRQGQGKIFSEDMEMLERQQRNLLAHPERKLLALNIDAGGVQSRRVIERWLQAELVAAGAVLAMLDRNPDKKLSELKTALPDAWTSLTMSPHCDDELKYGVLERIVKEYSDLADAGGEILGRKIVEAITVNGVRVHLEDGSWVLVRASSNKPELVVVVESMRSEDDMRDLFRKEIKPRLAAYPEIGAFNQEI